ncbi:MULTISPECIES: WG repeat-containing protein [Butyricimonas]|uniref:WG repeat-containing protein n=1 Tax=Butyricimonas TaxID=574697 RepID=UPI0007FB1E1D|nr:MULTISPECIES: WG repeat-containing protein [Butyricimonas]
MKRLKNMTIFWKIIAGSLTACILIFTLAFCYFFYEKEIKDDLFYTSEYYDTQISRHIWYHKSSYDGKGYIFNCETGKKTLKDVSWITLSEEGDPLAVFSTGEKRGYFNIHTGKVSLPAQYSKAWIFSEGVAAVSTNDSLFFIDHTGEKIFEHGFILPQETRDYCFHNGYCLLANEKGQMGLIDKSGNWALAPEYDNLIREGRNYWSACKDGRWGVYSDSLVEILACEYEMVTVSEDRGIYISQSDHIQKRCDYDGTILDDFICGSIYQLSYDTGIYNENGETMMATAQCWMYAVETGYYGLISPEGKLITPPRYKNIEALGNDIYLCSYDYNGIFSLLLDSKGNIIHPQSSNH